MPILYRFLCVLALAAPAAEPPPPAAPPTPVAIPTIAIRVGQRYPLEGVLAQDARISPENVASVHETPEGVVLKGLAVGTARLTLDTADRKVEVRVVVREALTSDASGSSGGWDQSQLELRRLPGVRLGTLGGKLVVQGEILGRKAYQRVLLYLKTYPKKLIVLALPAAGIRESLMEQASSLLANAGLGDIKVSNAGHRFFLEGSAQSPDDVERAFELVQPVIPNIENHLAVPLRIEPTVLVRLFILELSRQAHEALGLSWPSSSPHALLLTPSSVTFNPTWIVNLRHLSASGQARVLAEPSLAVKAGAQAELSAGGEIPIRVTGRYENKVVWKHYGLEVKIRIAGLAGRTIRTSIEASSSQLDEATTVDGVPGIRNNEMRTEVDALEGQPILLTGLFQSSSSKDIERVPGIGSIPLLGELFKSRRYREHESELLVALLPSLGAPKTRIPLSSLHGLDFDAHWSLRD